MGTRRIEFRISREAADNAPAASPEETARLRMIESGRFNRERDAQQTPGAVSSEDAARQRMVDRGRFPKQGA